MTHNQVPESFRGWFESRWAHQQKSCQNWQLLLFNVMRYFVYILYSPSGDRFYTGSTRIPVDERLERHLTHYYGSSKFTSRYSDWEVFHTITCKSYSQALAIEKHIKRMKSQTYIKNLKMYPKITENLLLKYDS